jgi:transposase
MQTDYAGHTTAITDPATGVVHRAQIFVAVLGAYNYTFAWASLTQTLLCSLTADRVHPSCCLLGKST